MPRARFTTLTEQMFYVLLFLKEERCGTDLLDDVTKATNGRVAIGSGTLYGLLEQFQSEGLIRETARDGRRRSYVITAAGTELLDREFARVCAQVGDYKRFR